MKTRGLLVALLLALTPATATATPAGPFPEIGVLGPGCSKAHALPAGGTLRMTFQNVAISCAVRKCSVIQDDPLDARNVRVALDNAPLDGTFEKSTETCGERPVWVFTKPVPCEGTLLFQARGAAPVTLHIEPPPNAIMVTQDDGGCRAVSRVELSWPPPDHTGAPASELALFGEDEDNRALACPEDRVGEPDAAGPHRCRYETVGKIALGPVTLLAAATQDANEWDGMYAHRDSVVLLLPEEAGPRVLHTLYQWRQSVVDCHTELTQRRWAAADLDGRRGRELCVETVHETGEGLFAVLDLAAANLPWLPIGATRTFAAFRWDSKAGHLVPAPELAAQCPARGYALFAPTTLRADPGSRLRNHQGPVTAFAQCPLGPSDTCFELDQCPDADRGLAAVGGFLHPPVAPWGPPGTSVSGKADAEEPKYVGLRARVTLAAAPLDSAPAVAVGQPIEIRYEKWNVSTQILKVWHAGFWPNHKIHVYRADGEPAEPTEYGRRMRAVFGSPERGKNLRWTISPGLADRSEGAYDLARLFDMGLPGLYLVQVEYRDEVALRSNVLPVWVLPAAGARVLADLNGWDKDECDAFERPGKYPGRTTSGETNAFIADRKKTLSRLGITVSWDHNARAWRVSGLEGA